MMLSGREHAVTQGDITELAQVKMPTGEVIWVRVAVDPDVTDSSLFRRDGKDGRLLGKLKNLDTTIRGVVHSVGSSIAKYAPAETEIQFGIEVSGDVGGPVAVLASAHAGASIKVTLKWHKDEFPVVSEDDEEDRPDAEAAAKFEHGIVPHPGDGLDSGTGSAVEPAQPAGGPEA